MTRLLAAVVVATIALGCRSSSAPTQPASTTPQPLPQPAPPAPSPAPTPLPGIVNRIVIRSTGMNPPELTIAVGTRVTFANEDSMPHDMAGGPDPAHPDCREIDAVGFLVSGQSRETNALTTARTCDYHDHSNHSPLFTGRIIIR
jgi:hypothetical protein